jgi:hypothetical protein
VNRIGRRGDHVDVADRCVGAVRECAQPKTTNAAGLHWQCPVRQPGPEPEAPERGASVTDTKPQDGFEPKDVLLFVPTLVFRC